MSYHPPGGGASIDRNEWTCRGDRRSLMTAENRQTTLQRALRGCRRRRRRDYYYYYYCYYCYLLLFIVIIVVIVVVVVVVVVVRETERSVFRELFKTELRIKK